MYVSCVRLIYLVVLLGRPCPTGVKRRPSDVRGRRSATALRMSQTLHIPEPNKRNKGDAGYMTQPTSRLRCPSGKRWSEHTLGTVRRPRRTSSVLALAAGFIDHTYNHETNFDERSRRINSVERDKRNSLASGRLMRGAKVIHSITVSEEMPYLLTRCRWSA